MMSHPAFPPPRPATMKHPPLHALAFVLSFGAAALPAMAESSIASSASQSVSTSVGSVSDSLKHSSNSSSKDDVAQGDYKLIELAAAADRPGFARLTLQPLAGGDAGRVELLVPQAVVDTHRLAQGDTINARHRPYGIEFANGQPRAAFFLVVADDWYRELKTRPVTL